jgi:acyl-CoA synthetase (AMP-forming)/AMP-acid ligase II
VIEYCGGTEIGGGYITGTVLQPASPATFTLPALGLDLVLLDEAGQPVDGPGEGEVFLVPPSIGLSETLLNRDHDAVYFDGCPPGPSNTVLRRHGDQLARLAGGFYRAQGRSDDTMNLGGIKVSSKELERVLDAHPSVHESAAVAVQPEGGGADRLVVFAPPSCRGRSRRPSRTPPTGDRRPPEPSVQDSPGGTGGGPATDGLGEDHAPRASKHDCGTGVEHLGSSEPSAGSAAENRVWAAFAATSRRFEEGAHAHETLGSGRDRSHRTHFGPGGRGTDHHR